MLVGSSKHSDVVIIGGGIGGPSLANGLVRYTPVSRTTVLEANEALGLVASNLRQNSQTNHNGERETNYTAQKAEEVARKSRMNERFCIRRGLQDTVMRCGQSMALGVGDDEVRFMLDRFEAIRHLYPNLEVFQPEDLAMLEPMVMKGADGKRRPEPIVGVGSRSGYTTIDFGALANALMDDAMEEGGDRVALHLGTKVLKIEKAGGIYEITTNKGAFTADYVVVNAGAHSLSLAHGMGYGLDLSCLPIAGFFYMANAQILNGKVYMVQHPELPFAALHGDPDLTSGGRTRFGPTALPLPKLELNGGIETYLDALRAMNFDRSVIQFLGGMMLDPVKREFIVRNLIYETPYVGKRAILRDLHKIVPSLRLDQIEFARGFGGIRPQIYNHTTRELMLGEAGINTGDGLLFNMTPSPGATSGIGNGIRDTRLVAEYLHLAFDEERFERELG